MFGDTRHTSRSGVQHGYWMEGRTRRQDAATRRGSRPGRAPLLGPHRRARGPARGCDVRSHVRLPAHHGAEPQPRHHDERCRHDHLLADRQEPGSQLPRHQCLLRRRRSGHLRPRGRACRRHRRDPRRRRRPGPRRGARALRRLRSGQQDPAAGRHGCRGDAHRAQPRRGRSRNRPDDVGSLLGVRPVDRTGHHDHRDRHRSRLPRLHRPDRDLRRPHRRLPGRLARRRDLGSASTSRESTAASRSRPTGSTSTP